MKPVWIACLAAYSCLVLCGQQLEGLHDAASIGPAIGAAVPAFSLTDQSGHKQTLETLMGPQGLVLVFFRSADW